MPGPERDLELSRIDYRDESSVRAAVPPSRSGLQWSREVFEGAPRATRASLRIAWRCGLLLQLARPGQPGFVFGWRVLGPLEPAGTPRTVLAARSRVGILARLSIESHDDRLILRTFIQYEHRFARAVWFVVAPVHRAVVRHLLRAAARRGAARRAAG